MSRVALVTGASRGVGKGIARTLGDAGWTVYVTGRGPATGDAPLAVTAAEITARGGRGRGDVRSPRRRGHRRRVRADRRRTGRSARPAGQQRVGRSTRIRRLRRPFWERPLDDWDSLIGLGLRAHYVASVAAARLMVPRRTGLIVNISSFGTRGHLHSVLYGISKAGLDKMASDMAADLRDHDVHAVSLWPGSCARRGSSQAE